MDWITTSGKRNILFFICFVFLQTHFILLPSTLICIPISSLFVWVFLISRGLYWLFCGHFTQPRVYSDFFASYRASGWRREKRIGAVYDYLDLIVGGRFVSWDSILFLMMD